MSVIAVLDPFVSNQIAAGEVVERPSSVVKELIENCIDAGATAISVDIVDGGLTSIKVTDNGCGMVAEDAARAFLRHATSKIRHAEDLSGIATLGFRGEALAAIASVSRIKMWTRPQGTSFGTRIELEGGEVTLQEPFGAPQGTSITVSDLFFNTPARKKFMKRPHVEAGYVQETIMRAILSRPDVSFRFTSQGRSIYYSSGDGDLENALSCVYAKEVRGALRPVKGTLPNGSFEGFVGDVTLSRTNRKREHIAINGRPVNCFAISLAVEQAFDTQLMVHKFPLFALHLHIPNDAVDVNVHPSKLEVRLREESAIAQVLTSAIAPIALRQENPFAKLYQSGEQSRHPRVTSDALFSAAQKSTEHAPRQTGAQTSVPIRSTYVAARDRADYVLARSVSSPDKDPEKKQAANMPSNMPSTRKKPVSQEKPDSQPQMNRATVTDTPKSIPQTQPEAFVPAQTKAHVDPPKTNATEQKKKASSDVDAKKAAVVQEDLFAQLPNEQMPAQPTFRMIGQFFSTYLLLEAGTRLLVVDQHAAHERLLFDKYCAQLDAGDVVRQPLLVPYVTTLTASEMETFLEQRDFLCQMGFDAEEFGPLTVTVRTVPMLLGQAQMDDFLHEVLEFLRNRTDIKASELKHAQVATIACKAAIKAGDALSREEIDELMLLIAAHRGALTCPHGRPIYFEMSKYEIEKRFKRV